MQSQTLFANEEERFDANWCDVYRKNLKNRFLTASGLSQNSHFRSRLALRQWSLAPNADFENPPCQIPDPSSCSGIIAQLRINKTHPDISRVYLGASNVNYHIRLNGSDLFVRLAPLTREALYASQQIEFDVLRALEPMQICAKPFYYDQKERAIVTEFIPHHDGDVDLLDPDVQKAVCVMLKKIEDAGITINRTFCPYQDTLDMVNHEKILCGERLSDEFYECFLPALKQIDQVLALHPRNVLCHLDLHHKNILEDGERLWLIDWEYATMSHPYLTLASMASIERWSDEQMFALLAVYTPGATDEDRKILYLYRIVADLFWTVWNHVQNSCSSIRNPYDEWRELFYKAAKERLSTPQWEEAVQELNLVASTLPLIPKET